MSKFYAGAIVEVGWTDVADEHHLKEMEYLYYDEEDELLYCRDEGQEICFDAAKITRIIIVE